jgi:hypothetical protein
MQEKRYYDAEYGIFLSFLVFSPEPAVKKKQYHPSNTVETYCPLWYILLKWRKFHLPRALVLYPRSSKNLIVKWIFSPYLKQTDEIAFHFIKFILPISKHYHNGV